MYNELTSLFEKYRYFVKQSSMGRTYYFGEFIFSRCCLNFVFEYLNNEWL